MKMNIEFLDPSQAAIEIPKTEPFIKSAQVISDKLNALNLPNQQHDSFVRALLEHTELTRAEAFKSGIKLGLELAGVDKGGKK